MSDQVLPLRYETTVKDGASAVLERIIAQAERMDAALLKVQRDQQGAAAAATRATDQAATAAASSAGQVERTGASLASLGPRYRAVAGEMGTATDRVRGLGAAAGVMGQALESAGVAGGGAAAALGGKLSLLTAAGGPAAVAIGALGVTVWGLSAAFKAAAAESDRAIATARQWAETSSASASIGKVAEGLRRQREASAAGTTTDVLAAREEIRSIQARETALINLEANRLAAGDEEGARAAAQARPALVSQRQRLERDLTTLVSEEERKRTDATRRENEERIRSFEQFSTAAADAIRKVEDETQRVKSGGLEASPLDQRLSEIRATQAEKARAEIERQRAQIDAQERARVEELRAGGAAQGAIDAERARYAGLRDVAGVGVHAQVDAETRALVDRERAKFEALERIRIEAAAATYEKQAAMTRAATEAIGKTELDAQLTVLAEQRRQAVEAAERRNEDVSAVNLAFDAEEAKARATAAQRARQDDEREAARRISVIDSITQDVATAAADLQFDVEQSTRDATEQQVAEVQRRYQALIDQARAYGVETVRLEEELAAKVKKIREDAAASAPAGGAVSPLSPSLSRDRAARDDQARAILDNPNATPTEGAQAAMLRVQNQVQTSAELAATSVDALSAAFVQFGNNATSGAQKAGEAMKQFGRDVLGAIRQIATQQLAVSVLGAIFGNVAGGSSPGGFTAGGVARGWTQTGPSTWAPATAEGGVFSTPQTRMFGEAGPEAVVPLSRGRSIPVEMRAPAKGGGGDVHVHVAPSFTIYAMDSRDVNRALAESAPQVGAIVASEIERSARIRAAIKGVR